MDFGSSGLSPVEWNICTGWLKDDIVTVEKDLDQIGIQWLDQHAEPEHLTVVLESALRDGVPANPPQQSLKRRLFGQWLTGKTPSTVELLRPPVFRELLANLYYGLGNPAKSAQFMREWIEFWKGSERVRPYISKLAEIETSSR